MSVCCNKFKSFDISVSKVRCDGPEIFLERRRHKDEDRENNLVDGMSVNLF